MAINRFMRLALKALSYPDVDLRKTYPLERTVKELKAVPILKPYYKQWDRHIYCEDREILTRVYTPDVCSGKDTLLFFHGGGWVTENIDTYNSVCRNLSKHTQSRLISVEYSLAPEHRFPQGLEDCYAVAKELFLHPESQDVAPGKVTLIGDSAGANLAAAVSLMARDRGEFAVPRQILFYPATYYDHSDQSPFPSVRENGSDYLLTSHRLCDYMSLYKRNDGDLTNPYFAPLLAKDFSRQPKTLIITAQYDPLRDEGEAYGHRLKAAGNEVEIYRMKDALHGFLGLGPRYIHVKRSYELINRFLQESELPCPKDEN